MRTSEKMTTIYLACFHSEKPKSFDGTKGQFLEVETAIDKNIWPYDNGDDPSFYVARKGGRLTWGVCRQDLRNAIKKDSIVVFFSFTQRTNDEILYRLCAVATVEDRVDHRAIHSDHRLLRFQNPYINGLITPMNGGWRYDENDRRNSQRHKDWLWRITEPQNLKKELFNEKYENVYREGKFTKRAVTSREIPLAKNYIVFSAQPDHTFISPDPPKVAIARKGRNEKWSNKKLHDLTVGTSADNNKRDYLRTANNSGGYVHRQIRFEMSIVDANKWRDKLILALKEAKGPNKHKTKQVRTAKDAKC
jgi:hypothetical protein